MEQTAPTTAVPTEPSRVLPMGQRRIVLGLVAGLMLLAATVVVPCSVSFVEEAWEHLCALPLLGGLLAVPTLVTAWGSLATQPLAVRGPRVLGLTALLLLGFTVGLRFSIILAASAAWMAYVVLMLFVTQAVLWSALRGLLRWRLVQADEVDRLPTPTRGQFTVRQALLWTAGTAVLLALAKCVLPQENAVDLFTLLNILPFLLIYPAVVLAFTFPTAVASLGWVLGDSRRWAFGLATGFLVLVTMAVLFFLVGPSMLSGSPSMPWEEYLLAVALPLSPLEGFAVVYLGTLGILRLCGYRLVHYRPSRLARLASTGSSPFAPSPAPPRSLWWTPFPYLVSGLVLTGLALCIMTVVMEVTTRDKRATLRFAQYWQEQGVNIVTSEDQLTELCFESGEPVSKEALQKLTEFERPYREQQVQQPTEVPQGEGDTGKPFPRLSFEKTGLTDAQLPALAALPHLQDLDLRNTPITDEGLKSLAALTNLEKLQLSGTKISDVGLESLKPLEHLQRLELSNTAIGDAGLLHLQHLPALVELNLLGTKITDQGLQQLESCPQLRQLHVGPPVSHEAASRFKQSPNRHVFYYPSGPDGSAEEP